MSLIGFLALLSIFIATNSYFIYTLKNFYDEKSETSESADTEISPKTTDSSD